MITDGVMDVIDFVARTSINFVDRVIVEYLGFLLLLDLFDSIGVDIVGVLFDGVGFWLDFFV